MGSQWNQLNSNKYPQEFFWYKTQQKLPCGQIPLSVAMTVIESEHWSKMAMYFLQKIELKMNGHTERSCHHLQRETTIRDGKLPSQYLNPFKTGAPLKEYPQ